MVSRALEIPSSFFGSISNEEFLVEYWQQKPLLVRNAWPNFITPILPSDLKKMSCQVEAESRLVLEKGGDYPWEVRFGPFEMEEFRDLPDSNWSLLIQRVDQLHPEVGRMFEVVNFLPNWRLDDIMVSYAPGRGGVGPHIDNYDVFLLQAHGRRRWQINTSPIREENIVPDLDVRVLEDFRSDTEWILDPGDMLYLPPRIAHFGVALGHCMTFSIGCRAPTKKGLITSFLEEYLTESENDQFFSDPGHLQEEPPGKIGQNIKDFAREALSELLTDQFRVEKWLGRYFTMPGADAEEAEELAEAPEQSIDTTRILHEISTGKRLFPASVTHIAYDRLTDGTLVLFADGIDMEITSELEDILKQITRSRGINAEDLPTPGTPVFEAALELIQSLLERGILVMR